MKCPKHIWIPPWWKYSQFCLFCGQARKYTVGPGTITLQDSKLVFSSSGIPATNKELTMNLSTGRLQTLLDGTVQQVAVEDDHTGFSGTWVLVKKNIRTARFGPTNLNNEETAAAMIWVNFPNPLTLYKAYYYEIVPIGYAGSQTDFNNSNINPRDNPLIKFSHVSGSWGLVVRVYFAPYGSPAEIRAYGTGSQPQVCIDRLYGYMVPTYLADGSWYWIVWGILRNSASDSSECVKIMNNGVFIQDSFVCKASIGIATPFNFQVKLFGIINDVTFNPAIILVWGLQ
jgi:hypothetical protein